jgi:two-component system response regulator TctD
MRLLLVEDTDDLAESLLRHLRQTGHTVDHAPTLKIAEGLWHSEKEAYEIIILDIELPDGEGTTLLKQVRGSALPVGILVLTARSEIEDKVYLLDEGADDYLTKPFALDELDARLRAVKRRHVVKTSSDTNDWTARLRPDQSHCVDRRRSSAVAIAGIEVVRVADSINGLVCIQRVSI